MNRVIKRDVRERGKNFKLAKINFLKSWEFYYSQNKKYDLTSNCTEITYSQEKNLDPILKKLLI